MAPGRPALAAFAFAAACLVTAAGARRLAAAQPPAAAALAELWVERPRGRRGSQKQDTGTKRRLPTYPVVTLGDLSRQDRDLLDSKPLLLGLGRFPEALQEVSQDLARLEPGFEVPKGLNDLRQQIKIDKVIDCSDRNSIVFGAKFTDRDGTATLRLDSHAGEKYSISLLPDPSARRTGTTPTQLFPGAEMEEERVPEGAPPVPVSISGSMQDWMLRSTPLVDSDVHDKLIEVCNWRRTLGLSTSLTVELYMQTVRGRNLVDFQESLQKLDYFVAEGSSADGPLLRLRELGENLTAALWMARYAVHPHYSLRLGANLSHVKQELSDIMQRFNAGMESAKAWRGEADAQLERLREASQRALGDGSGIAEHVPEQERSGFVPVDGPVAAWLPGNVKATADRIGRMAEKFGELPGNVEATAGWIGRVAEKIGERSGFIHADGPVPAAWLPGNVEATADQIRRTLEKLWVDAVLAHAPIASAYTRARRLLTADDEALLVADSSSSERALAVAAAEGAVAGQLVSASTDATTPEEDCDFLRTFVLADLGALSDDELMATYSQLQRVSRPLQQAIYLLSRDAPRDAEIPADAAPAEVELSLVQGVLRRSAAFGYPALLMGAEEKVVRRGFRLPLLGARSAENRWSEDKQAWARHWTALRASMDFSVWPVGSTEQPMAMPKFCQSTYTIAGTDELVRFPKWVLGHGGKPIPHEFLVFAGGKLPERQSCVEILTKMADEFPLLSRTQRSKNTRFKNLHEKAARLGCLGLEHWGETGGKIRREFNKLVSSWQNITVTIKLKGERAREVSISGIAEPASDRKLRRTPTNEPKAVPKLSKVLIDAVVKYAMHTVTKYTARSEPGTDFMQGVRDSLARHPPSMTPQDLSVDYAGQLKEQGFTSPYNPERCKKTVDSGKCKEFEEWNESVLGFWDEARLAGDSLTQLFEALEEAVRAPAAADAAVLAQTPAVFAAVGFDAPGVIDNGGWTCENTTQVCKVHPRCGRIAAQMLQYPFGGHKKYASAFADKALTFLKASQVSILKKFDGRRRFEFDDDGFHGYCHVPGQAYCWSYTTCLREMMNYLCHLHETADHCCPNADVRKACSEDVNDEDCNVCWDPSDVPEEYKSEFEQDESKLSPIEAEPLPEGIVEFLRPPLEVQQEADDVDQEELQPSLEDRDGAVSPARAETQDSGLQDEEEPEDDEATQHVHRSEEELGEESHQDEHEEFEGDEDRLASVPHRLHEELDEMEEGEDRQASVPHHIESHASIRVGLEEDPEDQLR